MAIFSDVAAQGKNITPEHMDAAVKKLLTVLQCRFDQQHEMRAKFLRRLCHAIVNGYSLETVSRNITTSHRFGQEWGPRQSRRGGYYCWFSPEYSSGWKRFRKSKRWRD
jgi:hypothetical protein